MNNLHLMVRILGRILLYRAPKDIISAPVLCSWGENVKGPYEGLYCLVDCPTYYDSNPILFCILMEFGGNLFRLRSSVPSSILAFVDGNKITLNFLIRGFLFWAEWIYVSSCTCVYFSCRPARRERPAAKQEFRSIFKGRKMNGVSFLIKVVRNRVQLWFIGIYLLKFCRCHPPSCASTSVCGALAAFLCGQMERRDPHHFLMRGRDSQLNWLFLHLLDLTPPCVTDNCH